MKKKILSLLLCMMMVASLAVGCGTKTENTQTNETSNGSNGEVTLTLWSIATESDAFHPAYTKAIADFEAANPGVKIVHETFENQSYKTKIKSAVAANELPDIFYTWGGGFSKPFVESGKVLALDDYFTEYKDELPEAALTNVKFDGKLYGSTYTTPLSAIFYNKKMFEENGVKVPTNWDEFIAACKTFKEKGITPIGISAKDAWVIAMTHDNLVLKSAGPEKVAAALTKSGQTYNDPDFIAASAKLRELIDMGAYSEGSAGLSNDEASAMFYNGDVAMFITGSWMAGSLQTDPENPEDFDVFPFPAVGGNGKATDFMGGATDSFMVNASTPNPDIAAKAAFELARSISKYAYLDGAGVAAWKVDYDDSSVNPITKKIAGFASEATSFTIWYDTLMEAEDAGEYLALLQELYMGNISPEDFAAAMANQLEQ
ncbi:extracellular solute-binding protein [Defluviitalea saccharophila]|uniref:Extracellular solute-binding protein n=1 Tax=Defluviitalea saccharophila TaxID=879970 RepID=A0ABZ2Y8I3_9FIRM